ncbi:MAG: hypothetical protein JKY15_03700 [Deltaproteobacteria bacterium]|nr:hypothetical protein [Deltaproteobacteria bacterium]
MNFCDSGERPMILENKSQSKTIWVGFVGGSFVCKADDDCKDVGNTCTNKLCSCSEPNKPCGTLGECGIAFAQGNSGPRQCFWKPPRLINRQNPKLEPKDSFQACFPAVPAGSQASSKQRNTVLSNVQWSGNLFARFGCDENGQNCKSAPCPDDNADSQCDPGRGGVPPDTLAEFTFVSKPSPDFYDISIINGINMGIAMAPDRNPLVTQLKGSDDPYFCATPGSRQAHNTLRACDWKIDLSIPNQTPKDQTVLLTQVNKTKPTPPAACKKAATTLDFCTCAQDSDCASGEVCGLAQNAEKDQSFSRVCGEFVAYWTADQIATSLDSSKIQSGPIYPIPFDKESIELFGCTGDAGAVSCYQKVDPCDCGCPTLAPNPYLGSVWPEVSSDNCIATNQTWVEKIQPWLVFMKKACPTAYTFPFDDRTSTFTCTPVDSVPVGEGPGYHVTFFDLN